MAWDIDTTTAFFTAYKETLRRWNNTVQVMRRSRLLTGDGFCWCYTSSSTIGEGMLCAVVQPKAPTEPTTIRCKL